MIINLSHLDSCSTVFSLDNGRIFETVNTFLLKMPKNIEEIPPLAINIGLVGLQSTIQNTSLLLDFLKKQENFKIKILFNIAKKYYVEVYNSQGKCLNSLLNPKFQTVIYGSEEKH